MFEKGSWLSRGVKVNFSETDTTMHLSQGVHPILTNKQDSSGCFKHRRLEHSHLLDTD